MSLRDETSTLRGKWAANEARIDELQAEIDDLQRRLLDAETENLRLKSLSGSSFIEASSLLEVNSQHAIDVTKRAAEQQKTLSATQLENARLKRSIAQTEAENAKLTVEIHNLKWRLQDMDGVSESNSTLTNSVDELTGKLIQKTAKLESANQTITNLRSELKRAQLEADKAKLMIGEHMRIEQENRTILQKIAKHKTELQRARMEIQRLTEKNEKSDEAIAQFEQSLRHREFENQRLADECKLKESSFIQQEDELSDLKDERDSLVKRVQAAEKALKELEIEKSKIENEAHASVKMLNEYKASFNEQEDELSELREANRRLQERAEKAELELQTRTQQTIDGAAIPPSAIADEIRRIEKDNQRLRARLQNTPFCEDDTDVQLLLERCQALELENDELKAELANRQASPIIEIENIPKTARQYLLMLERHIELKVEMWGSKFHAQLNLLDIQVSRLRTAWKEMCLLTKRKYPIQDPTPDTLDFVSHVERGVRSIDAISHAYAASHGYPQRRVPPVDVLLSQPGALLKFVDNVEARGRD